MTKLSYYLKAIRKEKNMSLREFSDYLGISHAYLNKLEKGIDDKTGKEISPTIDTLIKIANSLEVDTKSFFEICGFFDKKKSDCFDNEIDITDYVEGIIDKLIIADNITINDKPLEKSDSDIISTALEVALQIIIRNNHKTKAKA